MYLLTLFFDNGILRSKEGACMDGLERRYKVRLRKKYEEDITVANADIKDSSKWLASVVGVSAAALALGTSPIIFLPLGYSALQFAHSLVESIVQKTVLQTKIEDIDVQLGIENTDPQESVGKKR